jgi:hypothetical protein
MAWTAGQLRMLPTRAATAAVQLRRFVVLAAVWKQLLFD